MSHYTIADNVTYEFVTVVNPRLGDLIGWARNVVVDGVVLEFAQLIVSMTSRSEPGNYISQNPTDWVPDRPVYHLTFITPNGKIRIKIATYHMTVNSVTE
jgi:hypothetical protein